MGDCPTPEVLQQLLEQSLPEATQREIEAHIENCPRCPEVLDELTKGAGGVIFPLAVRIRSAQVQDEAVPCGFQLTIPNYEILGKLGHGGMAVVYKARHVPLGRIVALKMMLGAGHLDPDRLARLRAEAKSVARVQHPNIVQIFEVGEHEGRPFLALEYVEAGSLAQKLRGKPQPIPEAAKTVEALAQAIHHAHQQGVIHRDLKPANVLLTRDGVHKVTDFGLAKTLDQAGRSLDGSIISTAEYMAPEQATGNTKAIGPSTDVYALGAILYEMLTGRPPLQGESSRDTLKQVEMLDPVAPRHLAPKVPRDLETICLKCLEKESGRRYATAQALADDLRRFLCGQPIRARSAGVLERGLALVPSQAGDHRPGCGPTNGRGQRFFH